VLKHSLKIKFTVAMTANVPTITEIKQLCIFYLAALVTAMPAAIFSSERLRVASFFIKILRHRRLFVIDFLQFVIFALFLLFAAQGQAPFDLILKPFYHFTPIISSVKPSGASLISFCMVKPLAEISSKPSRLRSTKALPTKIQPVESDVPVFGFLLAM
jgi:hypothetical protein